VSAAIVSGNHVCGGACPRRSASGKNGRRRVHGVVLHFDIIDGKFSVQYDGTDRPVVEELEAAGVPREDIVLAFHSPDTRRLTGYAVG
jgi:hypothetical protein